MVVDMRRMLGAPLQQRVRACGIAQQAACGMGCRSGAVGRAAAIRGHCSLMRRRQKAAAWHFMRLRGVV